MTEWVSEALASFATAIAAIFDALSALANPLTAVVAGAAITAAFVRPWSRARGFILRGVVRLPLRHSRAWRLDADRLPRAAAVLDPGLADQRESKRWDILLPSEIRRRRRLVRLLTPPVRRFLDGDDILPADLVSDAVAEAGGHYIPPWPLVAHRLSRLTQLGGSSRATTLSARLLYPAESRAIASFLTQASAHLQRFCEADPVGVERIDSLIGRQVEVKRSDRVVSFPVFASALSGALVLVDSVSTRSGYVDDVLVWHARRYRSTAETPRGDPSNARELSYDQSHHEQDTCSLWRRTARRAGDYDKRVLTLEGIGMVESAHRGILSFVLETAETCYAATEQGETNPGGQVGSAGCKHLLPRAGRDPIDPCFEFQPWSGSNGYRLARVGRNVGRLTLVTAYVAIISSDGSLVLTRRSRNVRHGQGVISATAGGVIEPGGDGSEGDVNSAGMPDPFACVLRETKEELGLDLPVTAARPVVVFLANICNLGGLPRGGSGQLVAVVLYLCRVPEDLSALRARLTQADPALGRFEVDDLVQVTLPATAVDGDRTASRSSASAATTLALYAKDNAAELDQHGLLSCLYTAAILDGPDAAFAAFKNAFQERPWWDIPAGEVTPRLVRDPRTLLGNDIVELDQAVSEWSDSWTGLAANLDRANARETRRREE